MELQLFQDVVDRDGLPLILVDPVEGTACSFIDNVGISKVSQPGGMVEMQKVIQRQMLSIRLSSSIAEYISLDSGPCGSSIDSALSRTINISFDDRNGRRGSRLSGLSMPEPMALDRRRQR